MATDAFSAQIVELVRKMPDEAILELVKNRLGMVPFSALSHESGGRPARPGRPAEADPKSKRGGTPAALAAAKARRPHGPATLSNERKQTLDIVERVVNAGTGLSASEVARAAAVPQPRAAAALKELKLEKRIFQGGDRRFARYAADAKAAEAASLAARTSASGPSPVKKPHRKRAKAVKAAR